MRGKILTRSGVMLEIDRNSCSDIGKFWRDSTANLLGTSGNILGKALALGLLALVRVEVPLAESDRLGGDLDQLIVLDVSERPLEHHADRRRQADRLVLGCGAHIGKLLALQHIDLEIVVARVLADDHAAIDLPAWLDHHRPTVLEVPQRIGDCLTLIGRDQYAVPPSLDRALVRRIAVEQAIHDAGTARVGEELALIADEPTRRGIEHEALPSAA